MIKLNRVLFSPSSLLSSSISLSIKGVLVLEIQTRENPSEPFWFLSSVKENQSETMSNSTSISEEASVSSETKAHAFNNLSPLFTPISPYNHHHQLPELKAKKKRSQPDPDAEVIALSPKTLMATNRFVCEICNKGFQRDQNLQLHRRGHNLPWKLRQRSSKDAVKKRVYVCPETSCVHHHPSRALGDLTGIKKHFCRKHGEKKWKCERCSKRYAVQSDWKAHVKTCGTREYRCDCGTLFSRKDSFITHRAFCDALAEESARLSAAAAAAVSTTSSLLHNPLFLPLSPWDSFPSSKPNPNPSPSITPNPNPNPNPSPFHVKPVNTIPPLLNPYLHPTAAFPHLSATALLQKASTMGSLPATTTSAAAFGGGGYDLGGAGFNLGDTSAWQRGGERLTRDFLGVAGDAGDDELLSLTGLGLDLVTSASCDGGGDSTKPLAAFWFPPATEAAGENAHGCPWLL